MDLWGFCLSKCQRLGDNVRKVNNQTSNGFIGSFPYNIDSKSRVCIPPAFLDILDTSYKSEHRSLVVFLSLNRSIAVYPVSRYYSFLEDIKKKSILDKNMRALLTMIQGTSFIQSLDTQNRLRLNDEVLKYAGIGSKEESGIEEKASRQVYVKGFDDHMEIWAAEAWDQFIQHTTNKMEEISDQLSKSLEGK